MKLLEEREKSSSNTDSLISEVPRSRELTDIYLRHPANESSSDDEGEEMPPGGNKFIINVQRST